MLHEGKIRDEPGIRLYFTVLFSGVGTPISPLFTQKSPPPTHTTVIGITPVQLSRIAWLAAGQGRARRACSCGAGRIERLFYCGSCFVRGVGCVRAVAWRGSNAPCRALGRALVSSCAEGWLHSVRLRRACSRGGSRLCVGSCTRASSRCA